MLAQILTTAFVVGLVAIVAYGHVLLLAAMLGDRDHGQIA